MVVGSGGLKLNELVNSSSIPLKLSYKPRGPVASKGCVMIKVDIIPTMLYDICTFDNNNNNSVEQVNDEGSERGGGGSVQSRSGKGGVLRDLSYAVIVVAEHQEIVIPVNIQVS
jgi:hypothetical protein